MDVYTQGTYRSSGLIIAPPEDNIIANQWPLSSPADTKWIFLDNLHSGKKLDED